MTEPMVEVLGLHKSYAGVEVLKGVNLIFFAAALAAGAIYWLRRRRKS